MQRLNGRPAACLEPVILIHFADVLLVRKQILPEEVRPTLPEITPEELEKLILEVADPQITQIKPSEPRRIADLGNLLGRIQERVKQERVAGGLTREHCQAKTLDLTGCEFGAVDYSETVPVAVKFNAGRFHDEVNFANATFLGPVDFIDAQFLDSAKFVETRFAADAILISAKFSAEVSFFEAQFSGRAYFFEVTFGVDVSFMSVNFDGEAVFSDSTFSGRADFYSSKFANATLFRRANFSKEVSFRSSKFSDVVDFHTARCADVSFYQCQFIEAVYFRSASCSDLRIDACRVEKVFDCRDSTLKALSVEGISGSGELHLDPDQLIVAQCRGRLLGEADLATLPKGNRREVLTKLARQYQYLRDNFSRITSPDEIEDFCAYMHLEYKRRAKPNWLLRVFDWFFYKWLTGYGVRLRQVFVNGAIVIGLFTLIWWWAGSCGCVLGTDDLPAKPWSFGQALYFSMITFTTIGYGDLHPVRWARYLGGVEGLLGVISVSLFVVLYSRKIIR